MFTFLNYIMSRDDIPNILMSVYRGKSLTAFIFSEEQTNRVVLRNRRTFKRMIR